MLQSAAEPSEPDSNFHPEASCVVDSCPDMTDGAMCRWLLKLGAFVNKRHPGESSYQPRGSDDSLWLTRPEASSKTRKLPGTTHLKQRGRKIQRSKAHLIGSISTLISLMHLQCFVLVLFSLLYNTEEHDCTGRRLISNMQATQQQLLGHVQPIRIRWCGSFLLVSCWPMLCRVKECGTQEVFP